MTSSIVDFQYVAPALPRLNCEHQAVYDLAAVIMSVYPYSAPLGGMVRATGLALLSTDHQGVSVEQWLFAAHADLPSIDRVLALAGVPNEVPRPQGKPGATNAADMARLFDMSMSMSSDYAVSMACSLFWHIRDRVALILGASQSLAVAPGSELVQ